MKGIRRLWIWLAGKPIDPAAEYLAEVEDRCRIVEEHPVSLIRDPHEWSYSTIDTTAIAMGKIKANAITTDKITTDKIISGKITPF